MGHPLNTLPALRYCGWCHTTHEADPPPPRRCFDGLIVVATPDGPDRIACTCSACTEAQS